MPVTKTDVAREVLEELAVVAAGEEASAVDLMSVEKAVERVHASLSGKGLTTNGSNTWTPERIPDYVVAPYILLTAAAVCRRFGASESEYAGRVQMAQEAEREIRRQIAVPYNPDDCLTSPEDDNLPWTETCGRCS